MTRGGGSAETTLVPLVDRLRYMQFFRVFTVAAAGLSWLAVPGARGLTAVHLGAITAVYLLLSLVTGRVWRLPRSVAVTLYGMVLLADGLYLGMISYFTGGLGAPLKYLVLIHLIAVTLLMSFRTGLKVAIWHSLLVGVAYQFQSASILHLSRIDWAPAERSAVPLFLGLIWVVTLTTASFAAVNERELRRRNYDLAALARLAGELETGTQPGQLAEALVKAISEDYELPRLVLVAAPTGDLDLLAGKSLSPASTLVAAADDSLVRLSMRERATIRVARLKPADDPWLCSVLPHAVNIVAFPLYAEGTPLGVIVVEYGRSNGARIERRMIGIIERFVSQTGLALNNAWLLAQVKALAETDALTGVANRRTFDASLEQEFSRASRTETPVTVAMIDVDRFKEVNDVYGHGVGDRVLQQIAAVLATTCRSYDLAARYGGEEFVVIMPGVGLQEGIVAAERLRAAVEEIGGEPSVTASLGVACYPTNADDKQTLIEAADEALYAAKRGGRNRVVASERSASALATVDPAIRPVGVH
jgi:diguanylate cyclase (GGDEF)-like protein